jgi:hypothetical protein
MSNKQPSIDSDAQKTLSATLVEVVKRATATHCGGTLDIAEAILRAQKELDVSLFEDFVKAISRYVDRSKIRKLKRIGERAETFRRYVDQLPYRWTTLYELSKLGPDAFLKLMNSGKVHALATCADLKSLLGDKKRSSNASANQLNYRFELKHVSPDKRLRFLKDLEALCEKYQIAWVAPKFLATAAGPNPSVPNGTTECRR